MIASRNSEGDFDIAGARFGIIASRFNSSIVDSLLAGALDALKRHGALEQDTHVVRVPGAFELPLVCACMAQSGRYDALIALAVVIRGATAHFEYVSGACTDGIARVILEQHLPIGFGVLTVNNIEQAMERAGPNVDNKGTEAALSAMEMVTLLRQLNS